MQRKHVKKRAYTASVPHIQTKKPSHHGEKASLFTGKFERAIDLSCMAGN